MEHKYYVCNTENNSYRTFNQADGLIREIGNDEILVAVPQSKIKGLKEVELGDIIRFYAKNINLGIERLRRVSDL